MSGLRPPAALRASNRRVWLARCAAASATACSSFWLAPAWAQGQTPIAQPARRIVSIGGALTETLYALGAQHELVGVDTTSLYPAAAQNLPSVGYARALSAEGVLSLRPSLIVASQEAGPPAVIRQLQAAGIPMTTLDADHRAEGVFARTRRLAELCGRERAGQLLVQQLQQSWEQTQHAVQQAVQQRLPAAQGHSAAGRPSAQAAPRVLFVLSHSMSQVQVSGSGTAAHAMILYAGGSNAMQGIQGYKPLTPEAAIAAAPDLILATDQGLSAAGGIDGLLRAPGLAQTPAGRQRRVVALEALFMLGFGPRLPQAVTALSRAFFARPRAQGT